MKKFKAETGRILDLMINSIYTNKEIFLRELISNASDAIDKRHFVSLTDSNAAADFAIEVSANKADRIITVSDNGIGMNGEELEQNLGTIARSGTLAFANENKTDENLIGRFGVGFYSAFMVAKKVTVISKKYGESGTFRWESEGADGYTLTEITGEGQAADGEETCGTSITMLLKDDDEDCTYSDFTDEFYLKSLIKKYSDYIRYPIVMQMSKRKPKTDSEGKQSETEIESYTESVTVNSMVPIWKKRKAEVSEKEYADFIAAKFYETNPLLVFPCSVEGLVSFNSLVYIPKDAPYGFFTKEYKKGLQLYSSGVLVMESCSDLLPEYLGFVKGLVDSDDLSLNISRELLQKDRQLSAIAKGLEKKLVRRLEEMLASEREKYEEFFATYGVSLKFGLYNNFGEKKNELKDLILFYSSTEKKPVTLKEYLTRKKEGQEYIFYACGRSVEAIENLPEIEIIREKGYETLYLTDPVDEFLMKVLAEYDGVKFMSSADKNLDLDSELKKQTDEKQKQHTDLLAQMTELLGGRVKAVRLSSRLKNNAACLTADGELSLEMERVLKSIEGNDKIKAERILEINPSHPVFERLKDIFEGGTQDNPLLKTLTVTLYNQSLLLAGLNIDNAAEFAAALEELMK